MNGMLEIWPGLATVVTSGCSVASWRGAGVGMVGVRPSASGPAAGAVGSWVGCLACVGVGPLLRTGSSVAAWEQAANTSTRVVAARQRTVRTGLVRRRGIVIFLTALRKSFGHVSPFYPRMWNYSKFVDVLGVILHVLPGLWRGVVSGFMDAITAPPKKPPGTFPEGF